jgi:ribosomal protein L37AE/L43A
MADYMPTREEREQLRIFQPARLVVGGCPDCGRLIVIHNDHEVWPPSLCECGWAGATVDLVMRCRFESEHWREDLPAGSRLKMRTGF